MARNKVEFLRNFEKVNLAGKFAEIFRYGIDWKINLEKIRSYPICESQIRVMEFCYKGHLISE